MTFAYVMNKMGLPSPGGLGTERTNAYTRTAFSCADANGPIELDRGPGAGSASSRV
jgi:hypothetical protein